MDPTIQVAIISVVGSIIVALIGRVGIIKIKGKRDRRRNNIPDLMGIKWRADWYFEGGDLYIGDDKVTFNKWTEGNEFSGYGEVVHNEKLYKYSIKGEISPSRIVALTYKAEKYPTEAPIGTACLQLSDNAENLEGYWAGRAQGEIKCGAVKMQKIRASS